MNKPFYSGVASLLFLLTTACHTKEKIRTPEETTVASYTLANLQVQPGFKDSIPELIPVDDSTLLESSGLAFSYKYTHLLYTHEDSKCSNLVTVLNDQGKKLGALEMKGITNRDWEDISVAAPTTPDGPSYIYLADIGDNSRQFSSVRIYRFPEPDLPLTSVQAVIPETMELQYPNGPVNAETLLTDPVNPGVLYIVSKEKEGSTVYKANWRPNSGSIETAQPVARLPFVKITGGDISADGTGILLRNKETIYYWKKLPQTSVEQALLTAPGILPHRRPWQSEGIAFMPDGSGFCCSTEVPKKSGSKPELSRYKCSL